MRFGIFDQIELSGPPLHVLYRDRLELAKAADQAGFWMLHKSEHHMVPLDGAPDIGVFFAAAAQHTTRLRFASLVHLLPFHHPLRLAETVCMLDHLLEGRFELGVGKGISPPEHELWGLDPQRAYESFDETLQVLVAALTQDRLDFEGEHYHFFDVPILLHPYQQPHPPLWYAGNAEAAAKHAMNCVVAGPLSGVRRQVNQFRELSATDATIGGLLTIYVAPTQEEAQARIRPAWAAYSDHLTPLFRKWGMAPPNDPTLGGDVDLALQLQVALAGSPATVAEFVARYEEETGTDYLVLRFAFGDLTHAEVMHSLSLFAERVMLA